MIYLKITIAILIAYVGIGLITPFTKSEWWLFGIVTFAIDAVVCLVVYAIRDGDFGDFDFDFDLSDFGGCLSD